jgi:hypothetical protein
MSPTTGTRKIHASGGNFLAAGAFAAHGAGVLGLALVLTFASWLTLHLAIAAELFRLPPRWRSALCLLPPLSPLGPYWALREGMHRLAAAWLLSAVAHLALVYVAYR